MTLSVMHLESTLPNETKIFLGSENNWKIWDVLNLRENINEVSRERAWKLINLEWFIRSI